MNTKNNTNIALNNLADVTRIENISPKVSSRYVPIYSSQIIELLAPEFTFVGGVKFIKAFSSHYIDLTSDKGDYLRIYNSYDRTLAVRVSLVSEGVTIPLGIERLVHKGSKAKGFTESLGDIKKEMLTAIDTAKEMDQFLRNTRINTDLAKVLTEAIFVVGNVKKEQEKVTEINNFTDVLMERKQGITIKEYLKKSVNAYIKGEYTYTKDGTKRDGKKKSSMFVRLKAENKIMEILGAEYPELFL